MKFSPTGLEGLWIIDLDRKQDERGFFVRTYCQQEFARAGLNTNWPQCNLTRTKIKGMIRGLHFQAEPKPETKLIRCNRGSIFDVIVDVRKNSPTYGKWLGFELSEENQRTLYVPGGFAHGFQCLTDDAEVFYQMSEIYYPDLARGIRWNDPSIKIQWPIADAYLSGRDRNLPDLNSLA
jgi:dTDP-4-dehydrorhamnose 3,5-epimerase